MNVPFERKYFRDINFIKSFPSYKSMGGYDSSEILEVAFIGRSNSGKSTLLNSLCEKKNLAKSGKAPGVTKLINVFANSRYKTDDSIIRQLIDLPGYGYAKISHQKAKVIAKNMQEYLINRQCLKAIVMLIDCRQLFKDIDFEVIKILPAQIRLAIAMSKVDKISSNQILNTKSKIKDSLVEFEKKFSKINIFPISTIKNHRYALEGIIELRKWLMKRLLIKSENI